MILRSFGTAYGFLKSFVTFPAFLFVLLWVGINTGPWVFRSTPQTLMEYINYFRTLIPYIDIGLVSLALISVYRKKLLSFDISVRMWFIYGMIALFSSLLSPHPFDASYWAFAYLSVFAVSKLFLTRKNTLSSVVSLNHLSWLMTTLFLFVILAIYKDALIGQATGYGVVNRVHSDAMALPRASGVARFAAIPAIVGFVLMWNGRQFVVKLFWGTFFLFAAYLVYFMQSRGAIFGLAGTIVLVMAFMSRRVKLIGTFAVFLLFVGFVSDLAPSHLTDQIYEHIMRGQTTRELESFTGRTRAWEHAWEAVWNSPVFGYGFQADRWLIGEHVHDAYMYALMTAGFVGVIFFILGYVFVWIRIFGLFRRIKTVRRLGQETLFVQVVGIITFFTLRSIPEVSGAMYAVDFVVLIPAMLYLGVLRREIRVAGRQKAAKKTYP